ncbi:PadR family transcriptional regulator [Paenibacillus massiliensis]|uniref:PadR family transcriptional regulator n=1 Tax=Paenibacillus massiliensis TaxID=225917 RepID=UPI0004181A95|nr:PadR family transcriptional regulator [Paenibacillus massiliensis]
MRHGHMHSNRRFFGKGRIKYALLDLLRTEPMHGYQMMKSLEIRSGGRYIPSPGSIYPVLQMLQERELISMEEQNDKKVYSITAAGAAFLLEHEQCHPAESHVPNRPEFRGITDRKDSDWKDPDTESGKLVRCIADAELDYWDEPERLTELNRLFGKLRQELMEWLEQQPARSDKDSNAEKEER